MKMHAGSALSIFSSSDSESESLARMALLIRLQMSSLGAKAVIRS